MPFVKNNNRDVSIKKGERGENMNRYINGMIVGTIAGMVAGLAVTGSKKGRRVARKVHRGSKEAIGVAGKILS